MRARRYSILALAAGLAACGSSVPVGAANEAPVQKPATEPLYASEAVLAAEPIPTRYANSPVRPGEFAVEKAMGAKCTEDNWSSGRRTLLMDRYCIGAMPQKLRQIMLALPEGEVRLSRQAREQRIAQPVKFVAIRGLGREADFLVETSEWWIRSFGSPDPQKTVYWVSAPFECRWNGYEHLRAAIHDTACAGGDRQSRIYRPTSEGELVDVTLEVLPPDPVIKPYWREYFREYGAGDLALDDFKLQHVPVMRWMMEVDPDRPLPDSDPHAFAGGVAHFGFLVWRGDRFTLEQRVPRRLWPCRAVYPRDSPCSDSYDSPNDPFVVDEPQPSAAQSSVTEDIRDAPFGEPTVPFPKQLIGLWAASSDVCQSLDGEGWIRIAANLLTGYEVAVRPLEIRPVGTNTWVIESEENYLGTQFAKVSQAISLNGRTLTVRSEGGSLERYIRCGA